MQGDVDHGRLGCVEGGACVDEQGLQGVGHDVGDRAREEMTMCTGGLFWGYFALLCCG